MTPRPDGRSRHASRSPNGATLLAALISNADAIKIDESFSGFIAVYA
jgi:hypothetical protein